MTQTTATDPGEIKRRLSPIGLRTLNQSPYWLSKMIYP